MMIMIELFFNNSLKSEIYKLQSQSISVGKPWIVLEN